MGYSKFRILQIIRFPTQKTLNLNCSPLKFKWQRHPQAVWTIHQTQLKFTRQGRSLTTAQRYRGNCSWLAAVNAVLHVFPLTKNAPETFSDQLNHAMACLKKIFIKNGKSSQSQSLPVPIEIACHWDVKSNYVNGIPTCHWIVYIQRWCSYVGRYELFNQRLLLMWVHLPCYKIITVSVDVHN